jgi:ElaB/YqjD/DUF883 family membrane-anchored ribosome-binding protein
MTDKWLKREQTSLDNTRESHPAYGAISISRVSGRAHLFGSEIDHMPFISLRVKEASRVIDGPREFLSGGKELIEVYMTESQFAQMITQPNHGDGVSCTLHKVQGDPDWGTTTYNPRPDPPLPEKFTEKFHAVVGKRASSITESLKKAQEAANSLFKGDSKPTKANLKDLQDRIDSAVRQMESNMPYVLEELSEGIEKKMSKAITEFETYVAQSLQAKGLVDSTHQLEGTKIKLLE